MSAFGYFDFRVTARPRRVHGSDDTVHMQAQHWPLRIAQHDERDCANRQILLVADIFVGIDRHIKSGRLGGFEQFVVLKRVPPSLSGMCSIYLGLINKL